MTVPDFPNRVRALKKRGGRMVVLDPRRTETAKVATEHHFVRPGHRRGRAAGDAARAVRRGADRRRRRTSTTRTPWRPLVADFTPERRRAGVSGVPADDDPADHPRVRGGGRGGGVRPAGRLHPRVRLDLPVGDPVPQPADRQLRPRGRRAVPRAGRRRGGARVHRARPLRHLAEPGARDPRVRRRAAGRDVARGDRDARATARSGRCSRSPATRCCRRRTASGWREAFDSLDFMAAVDIYLNETTRHADVILPTDDRARARPLRPGLPRARRAQHRAVHPGGLREGPGRAARVGDLPRPGGAGRRRGSTAGRRCARGCGSGRGWRSAPPGSSPGCWRTGRQADAAAAARPPGGRRPRAAAAHHARAAADQGPADRPRARRWSSATWTGCAASLAEPAGAEGLLLIGRRHQQDNNSWMHNTARLTRGKPRHQLLMHPDDLAERGIADGALVTVDLTRRGGGGGGAGGRRHDARRRLPPPRLRPPGRRHPPRPRTRSPASRSTTSPTPSGSTSPATPPSTASPSPSSRPLTCTSCRLRAR